MNWKDILHYGTGGLLIAASAFAPVINTLPGIHVDATTAATAGIGILVAGLKGGWTSASAPTEPMRTDASDQVRR
jgi:hypothetical protein